MALGRRNSLFVGSQAGGRAAVAHTLIETAKLCGVDPEAWLGLYAGPAARPQDHQAGRVDAVASIGMSVVRLHVALEDIEPAVTRRIEVPAALRLDRLHLALQAAMPWRNYHLSELEAAGRRWGLPEPDYGPDHGGDGTSPAAKARLSDMLAAAGDAPMGHLYDFGDSWQHAITVEATLVPDPRHLYPRLTEVAGACPPEDVGGTPGYERFIEILADPDHPEHAELLTWAGGPFDLYVPPVDELRLDVLELAGRWKPRRR